MPPHTTTHHNPAPPTTTHHHPPPSTTSQNISTTTHHHQQPAKLPSTTPHRQPKYIHHQPPQSKIYPSKRVFYKKNVKIIYIEAKDEKHFDYLVTNTLCQHFPTFCYKKPIYKNLQLPSDENVRNLTSRPAVSKKCFFLHGPLHYFHYIHKKWFKNGM